MIKCLTFDLDDTLWDIRPVIKNMDLQLYLWLQQNAPAYAAKYDLENFAVLRKQVVDEYPEIAHSVTDIRKKGLHIGLTKSGYDANQVMKLVEQGFDVALKARQEVSYFPHVWPVLDELKAQGYIMGAITNGNADIYKVGLQDHFDFQFNAHDCGVEKPHPSIFEQMLAHAGLSSQQVIHIGDNPIADVQGAQQLGMSTVWVNVITQQWSHDFNADQQISCISELPTAVQNIVKARKLES
ncbi:MAG: HAD family hydrolase [Oceanospirillaceae bacterium]